MPVERAGVLSSIFMLLTDRPGAFEPPRAVGVQLGWGTKVHHLQSLDALAAS